MTKQDVGQNKVERIKGILSRYFDDKKAIKAAYLYGSVVAGKDVGSSDVDIALLTEPYEDRMESYTARVRYQTEISRLIGRDVDLVFFQEAGELLSLQILKNGQVVFEKDKGLNRSFRASRLLQCLDFGFLETRMQKGMISEMRCAIGK